MVAEQREDLREKKESWNCSLTAQCPAEKAPMRKQQLVEEPLRLLSTIFDTNSLLDLQPFDDVRTGFVGSTWTFTVVCQSNRLKHLL